MGSNALLPLLLLSITWEVVHQTPDGRLYQIVGNTSSHSDDGSSPQILLLHPFVYFGRTKNQIYVNHNGHLTFEEPWSSYSPQVFPMYGNRDIIAPFWTDLDNTRNGDICYAQYTSGSFLQQVTQDINTYFSGIDFNATWILIATWYEVAYYPATGTQNTFQAVLTTDGQHSFVLLNYGSIDATTSSIEAGYDTVNSSHHFTIPGSFASNASGSNSIFSLNSNVNVPGRWAFRVDHGSAGCLFDGDSVQLGYSFWSDSTCTQKCTCTRAGLQCSNDPCSFSQICQPANFQFSCQTVQRQTCTVSGDPHYYTFDNKLFHFQGTCTYVLSEQCQYDLPYYRVEGKNEHRGSTHVAWTRLVKVFVYNETIELVKGHHGEAKVNGLFASTPFSLRDDTIQVYESGFSVIVSTDFGLMVSYDANHYVQISVPYSYQNATCALCGNFNNHPEDDFQTREGETVSSDVAFANSWQAFVDDEAGCEAQCGGLACASCTAAQMALYRNPGHCGIIQDTSGPFAACHQHLPPQMFVESCVFDLCVGGGYQPILCQALNVYASQCQQNGIQPQSWRSPDFCEILCPANSHFESQGTGCPATCVNPNTTSNCPLPDQESCVCNTGYVLSGGVCVPLENCGCSFEGWYYNAGETFWTEGCSQRCECHGPNDLRCTCVLCTHAQECTIKDGHLGCYDTMSTCTVWGDSHYITFDGSLAHFQGSCSYIIAETMRQNNNETQFSVIATNNHRGNNLASFVSSVDVYLSKQSESVHVRIGLNRRIKVNGAEETLPALAGTFGQVVRQGGLIVFDAVDLTVQLDGHSTLLVRISQNYHNRVTGMCGNFNGDPNDDKVLPNGTLAQNDNHFGHSWKSSTSQTGCGTTDVRSRDPLNNCRFLAEYTQLCRVITNTSGPFSSCHLHSDPQPFFTSCVYDLCLYTPASGMLCSAVAAYERTCSVWGLNMSDWRTDLNCDESDLCEQLDCAEHEWCGKNDGVYGCFCDEHHQRTSNEIFDSTITCASSSGTMSVSRCQLFEAGFHSSNLHLKDDTCNGTIQNGRLIFRFDNDDHLCGTVLKSNGTHLIYENGIFDDVDTQRGIISRERDLQLHFSCVYSLTQAVSMNVQINALESRLRKKHPGRGLYNVTMIPYQDADFHFPLTTNSKGTIDMEIDDRFYVEVRTEGVDQHQISTVIDSCWATPDTNANNPIHWDLIISECPNPADGTVKLIQNGVSTVARFSFKMFTFTNSDEIYLHCNIHLCLLSSNSCTAPCNLHHKLHKREVLFHDSAALSMGPLVLSQEHVVTGAAIQRNGSSG
nr:alpha-tectorin isoform X1 [Nothobranchius furzeri]XP_054605672.1 alpha-tectorin isoform X1 [Nothobranchius furzeri]XP_054605673.1 alpha-tectorin isoform X1 [Nothobranchius furzeri]XP_054605674.1 alpha-tectorin isoform X1 [Nothobranchius furzeri]XP_054605675.1 alpha-tectorin isoform X1 [Nothobranchius furzeri]